MVLSFIRCAGTGALVAATLTACNGKNEAAGDDQPYVVATTGIWADVVSMVACDGELDVRTLVPAGGDPHGYEPSLRDRQVLDDAALVVTNGLGLEALLEDTIDDVVAGGVPVFTLADHVDTIPVGDHADDDHANADDGGDEHAEDGDDPHMWFDPARVAGALPALGAAMVEAGADAGAVRRCVESAEATLAAVDADVEARLASIPPERRVLVTNHDSLGYFAERYRFEVVGTVLPSTSTLTAANPAQLEDLAAEIESAGVPAIFTETLSGSTDATALADRLSVEVVELYTDSLGDRDSPAPTYAMLLRTDADLIATALAG